MRKRVRATMNPGAAAASIWATALGFAVAVAVAIAGAGPVGAATTRLPSEYRPVAAEGSARAAWVNPSGIGSSPWQTLVVEVAAVEAPDGSLDFSDPAVVSVAASTGRTAYAYRHELDDVDGVPDWAVLIANRTLHRNGMVFGSALEWRGGEKQSIDATLSLSTPAGRKVRAAIVLEDVLARSVDGQDGSRRWRGGLALRPTRGGSVYVSWDYDRLEDADEGRHWFGGGLDRAGKFYASAAVDDLGDWSARLGIRLGSARWSGAMHETEAGDRTGIAAIDFLGDPVVR